VGNPGKGEQPNRKQHWGGSGLRGVGRVVKRVLKEKRGQGLKEITKTARFSRGPNWKQQFTEVTRKARKEKRRKNRPSQGDQKGQGSGVLRGVSGSLKEVNWKGKKKPQQG